MSKQSKVVNIGIDADSREAITKGLSRLLADTYTLYLTTHNFHWNVTGPMFTTLHQMFEEQYTEMWGAVDEIAERIRALGHQAPGSYQAFSELATLPDAPSPAPKAMDMIQILQQGHEAVARLAQEIMPTASEADDEPTADLLTTRMTFHQQTAWMLRSMLAE